MYDLWLVTLADAKLEVAAAVEEAKACDANADECRRRAGSGVTFEVLLAKLLLPPTRPVVRLEARDLP